MTIPYFAADQNQVFVPALLLLLAVALLVCLPVVFAPTLRRRGRAVPVGAVAGVLAAAALAGAVWQVVAGVGTLAEQRTAVRTALAEQYGIEVTAGTADELVDGGAPRLRLPDAATAAGLATPGSLHRLRLEPVEAGSDRYEPTIGGKPVPR